MELLREAWGGWGANVRCACYGNDIDGMKLPREARGDDTEVQAVEFTWKKHCLKQRSRRDDASASEQVGKLRRKRSVFIELEPKASVMYIECET